MNEDHVNYIIKLYKEQRTLPEISDMTGMKIVLVRETLINAGIYDYGKEAKAVNKPPVVPEYYEEIVRLYSLGYSVTDISKDVKINPTTVTKWLKKACVYKGGKRKVKDQIRYDINEIIDLYGKGLILSEIAVRCNCSYDTVKKVLIHQGKYVFRKEKLKPNPKVNKLFRKCDPPRTCFQCSFSDCFAPASGDNRVNRTKLEVEFLEGARYD